jgi:hypothetical protein
VQAIVDGEAGEVMDLGLTNAGSHEIALFDLIFTALNDRSRFEVIIEAASPHGDARTVLRVVPERR